MLRDTRRLVAAAVLTVMVVPAAILGASYLSIDGWHVPERMQVPLALLVAIAVVTNVARLWQGPPPPKPKPRPTHLKIVVRNDETIH